MSNEGGKTGVADWAARIHSICESWNEAEKTIKVAEQVNAEIVNPAIYELRYAGRRIIEALNAHELEDFQKRDNLLHDAEFECCRAKHDAIDAITAKIASDMEIATRRLGANTILINFPQITAMYANLHEIREKVATSREQREDRDAIYATLEAGDLPELVRLHSQLKGSESLLRAAAKSQRLKQWAAYTFGFIGFLVGLFSLWINIVG